MYVFLRMPVFINVEVVMFTRGRGGEHVSSIMSLAFSQSYTVNVNIYSKRKLEIIDMFLVVLNFLMRSLGCLY